MNQFALVLVTAGSEAEAKQIATALVEEKLAACVSFMPIQSVYTWQGEIQQEVEWQLVIKTCLSCFPRLEARVQALHSYDVPEVIALPIQHGSIPYLDWLQGQVTAV